MGALLRWAALTLNATWADGDTALADATSGQDKTYTASSRKFTISVDLPSASGTKFTLDLDNDKAGDGITKNPDTDNSNNDDEDVNNDEDGSGTEATAQMVLTATSGDMTAYLSLYTDSTWDIGLSYYDGMDPVTSVSGTWALDASYNMVLTVTSDVAGMCSETTYTLTVDYQTYQYSGTITLTTYSGSTEFSFGVASEEESSAAVQMALVASSGDMTAYLNLYDDATWDIALSYYSGMDPITSVSGTWALDASYNMTLTVTSDAGNLCSEDTYTLSVDYQTYQYSGIITLATYGGSTEFSFAVASED